MSIRVAPECLPKIKLALKRHGFPSQQVLAVELGLSRSTITSFFTGKPVHPTNFIEISERLGLDWQAIADIEDNSLIETLPSSYSSQAKRESAEHQTEEIQKKGLGIDWQQVCRAIRSAENQARLTTNPLTVGDGVAFELDEIYVPLGLIERKQVERRSGDVSPEGTQLYEPESSAEVTRTFQNDEFFEQVLRCGRSTRIAIIGEPGAGKTTLLQKIAGWVLDNTSDMPIWISLADFQPGQTLKDYILQAWLERALPHIRKLTPSAVPSLLEIPKTLQNALADEFCNGKVWLLLDAADEMVVEVGNALTKIATQLTGWVADARVVLTCRLNVWDAGKNALEAFETYRNLDFSYGDAQTPDQVGQFIRFWFKDNRPLGERLRTQLDQTGKERIKDAVKNPLRLALLCRSWTLGQGELPNTKAGLYQQFTEALYEWKQERFPTSPTTRQKLNKALGELALRALNQEKFRFRFAHRFVWETLKTNGDLFELALQLGFVNQVGVSAEGENQGEKVYAFYHPTFQEYFAAQVISDWHYFLNHIPQNPEQGTYRIFAAQWKEVILLWLGREDILKKPKDEFIKALVSFDDGCTPYNLYRVRAYLLAGAGTVEFGSCEYVDDIVAQIVKWNFGYFDTAIQRWEMRLALPEFRLALQETERTRVIAALVSLLKSTEDTEIHWQVIESLSKIGNGNPQVIKTLVQLIESTEDEFTRRQAVQSLGIIGSSNPHAIKTLVQLIESTEDEFTRRQAAENLGKLDPSNPQAISTLIRLIEFTEDEFTRRQAAENLGKLDVGNQIAIAALVQLLESAQDEDSRWQAASSLGKLDPGNSTATKVLLKLIESTQSEFILWHTASSLEQLDPGNPVALTALVKLMESTHDEFICWRAASSIGKFEPDNLAAITALIKLIESAQSEDIRILALSSIEKLNSSNGIVLTALLQLIESTQDENIRGLVAESLGKIGVNSEKVFTTLFKLIQSSESETTRLKASGSLGKINPGNSIATTVLVQILKSTKNKSTKCQVVESLGTISRGNEEVIIALVELLVTTKNIYLRKQIAYSLKKILRDEQLVGIVTVFKKYLSAAIYECELGKFRECYKVIWHCAQRMSYPAFYQAWHEQPTVEVSETPAVNCKPINSADLPTHLSAVIAQDPQLSESIQLICIDVNKFIDPDNPAAEIYIEMVEQGCPERPHGEPTTMQALKVYWKQLRIDKQIVLLFYQSAETQIQGFSHSFLTALSKFDGTIGVVTSLPPQEWGSVQWFTINRPTLVGDLVAWIKTQIE